MELKFIFIDRKLTEETIHSYKIMRKYRSEFTRKKTNKDLPACLYTPTKTKKLQTLPIYRFRSNHKISFKKINERNVESYDDSRFEYGFVHLRKRRRKRILHRDSFPSYPSQKLNRSGAWLNAKNFRPKSTPTLVRTTSRYIRDVYFIRLRAVEWREGRKKI